MSFGGEVCPRCHGVGGQWEVVVRKTDEIRFFENRRERYASGRILRTVTLSESYP